MSDEELQLLITLDDPVEPPEEDTFNHLQIHNIAYWFGQRFEWTRKQWHFSTLRRATVMKCCSHLFEIKDVTPRTPNGCEECLKIGDPWLHLRLCQTCGHVGCCDDSKNKHATKHFHATNHPIIKSFEPGEEWGWCGVLGASI